MRITFHAGALAVGLALLAAPSGSARGATVLRLSFEELTDRSDAVVRGRVVGSTPKMNAAAGRISTFTEVQVIEAIKGAPGKRITVRQPGGEVGGIGQAVEGAARFAPGEEVVLFLQRAPDDATVFHVLSMSAGKVRLEKKRDALRAVRDLDGIAFVDPAPSRPAAPSPNKVQVVSSEDLGDANQFLGRVRGAAAHRATPATPAPAAPAKKEAKP
ncbi:MAG TPA: hypothetical protein VFA20_07025 [Myxococcaceae bacterium]|nr:hypothetical protein [Myxococcaceae bacterium]